MLIRSIHLRNIRSYVNETVDLPEGSSLLAGDIGSGKSTILLALEFALFGIQRGELSGSALLRHGTRNGSVTLSCRIADKEVTITRTLKRTDVGVNQEAGSLTVDGVTTDLTAQELKARVLELLNYPQSLLTKGKGPLFRYTVYTPQEEMKAILFEEPDARLETLRKLFNIDKYKRVRENSLFLLRDLRRTEGDLRLRIEELSRELKDEERVKEELETAKRLLANQEDAAKRAKVLVDERRHSLEAMERERFAAEEVRKQFAVTLTKLENAKERKTGLAEERERYSKQIGETEERLSPLDVDETKLKAEEQELRTQELGLKNEEKALLTREAKHEAAISEAKEAIDNIYSLEECPTCKQPVTETHKNHIKEAGERRIAEATEKLANLKEKRAQLSQNQTALEEKRNVLSQKLGLLEANRFKLKTLKQLKERLAALDETMKQLATQQGEIEKRTQELERQLGTMKVINDDEYHTSKRMVDEANTAFGAASVKAAELRKDVQAAEKELSRLGQRRAEQGQNEERLSKTRQHLAWLEKQLLNVAYAIEKALFSAVYGLFNTCFRDWFTRLIEDETVSVRLDAEFTPVITQNGYETTIENLSGGERTSVALAYRLALNRAVNDFLSTINTRDLLILDEPTDGFSSEQLDRVRDVLDQLNLRQVIIVSHEAQMEGYVDHVLRVQKQGHESRVSI
jgi:exonuclease SbcC